MASHDTMNSVMPRQSGGIGNLGKLPEYAPVLWHLGTNAVHVQLSSGDESQAAEDEQWALLKCLS
eukprot:97059-Pelagomonas_calceolata.AAC.5